MCTLIHSAVLRRMEPKLTRVVGARCSRGMVNFLKRPHQGSKVIQSSLCLKNGLRLPNLVGRTPDQSVMHCWGQRPRRGHEEVNQRSNCLGMPYGHQIWSDEAPSRAQCIAGVKGHKEVTKRSTRGQIA